MWWEFWVEMETMKYFSRNFSKPVRDFLVVLDEEETDHGKVCGHLNYSNNIITIVTITILMVYLCCPHSNKTHHDHQGGYLLRKVPSVLVWPQQKNIFLLEDLAKMNLKTLNICATMEKIHSGQAPTLFVLIWEM